MYGIEAIQDYETRKANNFYAEAFIRILQDEGDVFYGNGFVDSPNAPAPECINDVIWYDVMQLDKKVAHDFVDEFSNKPIC